MNTELKNTNFNNQRKEKGNSLFENIDSYTIIDLETTGLDSKNDKIIELAAIKVRNNKIISEYSQLINPGIEIDDYIINLTKIDNSMLETMPSLETKLEEYLNFIGNDVILGHNINFDINFIYDYSIKILNKPFKNNYIDTLRISKKTITDIENYKLKTLSKKLGVNYENAHRALNDCIITYNVYNKLKSFKQIQNEKMTNNISNINNVTIPDLKNLQKLKFAIKGKTDIYDSKDLIKLCRNNNITIHSFLFSKDYDFIILSKNKFRNYCNSNGNEQYDSCAKNVISEYQFYDMLGLNYEIKKNNYKKEKIRAKDITNNNENINEDNPFWGKEVVFTGTLEKMQRKDAMQIVANFGGKNRDTVTQETNYLVLGNNDYCRTLVDGKSSKQKKAEKYKLNGQDIEILSENVFYDMINDFANI